ncbi:hypothetical protein QBC47DRAFT_403960 [Echria macrotheca]|uniref:Tetratricopeptide repeat protein n=1 Tax=Echria macrotheca TaxID=438768 RepID=A0AAJ0B8V1_9PEZI|nr:hypothetical protein QBC47DRAFT_403960 [Echria macrotheca]
MAVPAPFLLLMAYISIGRKNWRGALQYLEQALPISRKQKTPSYEILILMAIGACQSHLENKELALANQTEAIDLALVTPDALYGGPMVVTSAANCLSILRNCRSSERTEKFYHKYYDRCMAYMNQPHPEARRMPFSGSMKDSAALWMARNRYPVLIGLGRQQEAIEVMRGYMHHRDVRKDDWEFCRARVDLADVLCRQGDDNKTEVAELLSSARDRGCKSRKLEGWKKAEVLRDIAILSLLALEDAAMAERDLIQCAQLVEQDGKPPWLDKGDIYFWLGECQEVLGELARASETFRKAAGLYTPDGVTARTRWGVLAECRAHRASGDMTDGDIYGKLQRLGDELGWWWRDHWPEKVSAYSNMLSGDIAQGLGHLDDARKDFEQALRSIDEHTHAYRGTLRGRQVFEGMVLRLKLESRLAALSVEMGSRDPQDRKAELESGAEE